MTSRTLPIVALVVLSAACDEFDPALYMTSRDAGPLADTGAADGGSEPLLSDTCLGTLPVRESSADNVLVDTAALDDDINAVGACTGENAPGNDGFFAVEMETGDKWHFHVRSMTAGRNPSIYVLGSSCDVRTCDTGDAIDRCGTDSDEHLSFIAPATGTYRIAIDDRSAGGGTYSILALRPTCGSGGMPEHSEGCDDGNTTSGDGCDAQCRPELSPSVTDEREPNDDPTGANVVGITTGESLTVAGSVGGRCDIDTYVVAVPAGGASLRVTMLNRSGTACADGTAAIEMVLWEASGRTAVGDGTVRTGNACPVIDEMHAFAQSLPAGEHLVTVAMDETERIFDYRLRFELISP